MTPHPLRLLVAVTATLTITACLVAMVLAAAKGGA